MFMFDASLKKGKVNEIGVKDCLKRSLWINPENGAKACMNKKNKIWIKPFVLNCHAFKCLAIYLMVPGFSQIDQLCEL